MNDPSPDSSPLDLTVDRSDMARVIERTAGQIEFALDDPGFPAIPSREIHQVLVVGMGGSALPVDILNDVLDARLPYPVQVSRHYHLPPGRGRRLVVFSSFSGNTEEVVEPLSTLPAGTPDLAIVTAGGRLAEIGEERGIPTIRIPAEREPDGFQPRCASGYIVTYMARLLHEVGYADVPFQSFRNLVAFLEGLDLREEGERIAREIHGRIPIFYTDETHVGSIARIAKIKMNENAKRPAFFNALPEANHNEMIGFSGSREPFTIVYLRDPSSHPRVDRRYEVLREVLDRPNVRFVDWDAPGKNRLQKVFAALTLADWISYYSALLEGVDPTPVALVEEFKRRL
jgi:glucose/mannose-6-phosphate isomerase